MRLRDAILEPAPAGAVDALQLPEGGALLDADRGVAPIAPRRRPFPDRGANLRLGLLPGLPLKPPDRLLLRADELQFLESLLGGFPPEGLHPAQLHLLCLMHEAARHRRRDL